uniref:Uncharacterized protein n=1 Tax=Knipowitschia caucasica TaxID=637954 RepID=A0AAV2MTE9_KNICA
MQSRLLWPLEQWLQQTHPGPRGREVPPAQPHHLRHHCLPSLRPPLVALPCYGSALLELMWHFRAECQCGVDQGARREYRLQLCHIESKSQDQPLVQISVDST